MGEFIVDEDYPLDIRTLPETWAVWPVGHVIPDIRSGFSAAEYNTNSQGVIHLRPGNIDRSGGLDLTDLKYVADDLSDLRLEDGDIVFNNTNSEELVGKTAAVLGVAGWGFSNHMTRLRPGLGLSNVFVAQQLHWLWMVGYFRRRCTHYVNQASISSLMLRTSIPLIVPPTADQIRIVQELNARFAHLDTGIAELRKVEADQVAYRESLLRSAYDGTLVPAAESSVAVKGEPHTAAALLEQILVRRRKQWEAHRLAAFAADNRTPKDEEWKRSYPEPDTSTITGLPALPVGWVWATVEQLTSAVNPVTYGVVKLGDPLADGVPTLRSSDVRRLRIELDNVKRISPKIAQRYGRTTLKAQDVVVTVRGTLGGIAVVPPECEGFNISREVARLALVQPEIAEAVAVFIAAEPSQAWLQQRVKGIAYVGINIEDLRRLPLPLPPSSQQRRIVLELQQLMRRADELVKQVRASLDESPALREAVLRNAMTGQLVPPDLNAAPVEQLFTSLQLQAAAVKAQEAARKRESRQMAKKPSRNKQVDRPMPLAEVLQATSDSVTPEMLFQKAGFNAASIDAFFAELREVDRQNAVMQEIDDDAQVSIQPVRR